MSIVRTTNLYSNSTGFNTPVVFRTSGGVQNGTLCKAWLNFNGQGSVSARTSFNVGSISDLGVGTYQINFSNAITANYAATVTTCFPSGDASDCVIDTSVYSTTACRIFVFTANVGNRDAAINLVSIFR